MMLAAAAAAHRRSAILASGRFSPPHSFLADRPRQKSTSKNGAVPGDITRSPVDIAGAPVNSFQMNQYVLACTSSKRAAIIDCGATSALELNAFLGWIKERNYDLVSVLQTHAHLDHVAGLNLVRKEYPSVAIYLHEKERDLYDSFEDVVVHRNFNTEDAGPLPADVQFFNQKREHINLGDLTLQIIHTPGHSPGHVGYYEPRSKSFFGGDLIMRRSIGRTDFPESDEDAMELSLRRLVEMGDDDMVIYPGHGPATSLKDEMSQNPFLKNII